MVSVTIMLDTAAAALYRKIADAAGMPLERVLSDALFRLAGELSLESLREKK